MVSPAILTPVLIPILFQFCLLTPSGGLSPPLFPLYEGDGAATSLKEGGGMKTQVLGQQAPLFEGKGIYTSL